MPHDTRQAVQLLRQDDAPLYFYTSAGAAVSLDRWYAGRSVFLTLSGPSLAQMDLRQFKRPGVVTWGVNNSWAVVRPNLWTCVDGAEKFHDRGWRDPTITKLVPLALCGQKLRVKVGAEFRPSQYTVADMPAVWFWQRNSRFEAADWLTQGSVCWGNDESIADAMGNKGIRSVMMATIRLAYAVGFRTIYLCGADFKMEEGKAGYAFDQKRDRHAVNHNNRLFKVVGQRLEALSPYFHAAGLRVVNCTPGSGLTVFPSMDLEAAVREATADCCRPMDTAGWYDPPPEKPDPKRDEKLKAMAKLSREERRLLGLDGAARKLRRAEQPEPKPAAEQPGEPVPGPGPPRGGRVPVRGDPVAAGPVHGG